MGFSLAVLSESVVFVDVLEDVIEKRVGEHFWSEIDTHASVYLTAFE